MSSACRSRQAEARDQRRLGLVALADDADHLVDVEQHELPAFEDVDAVVHLGQAVLGAPAHGGRAGSRSTPSGSGAAPSGIGRPSSPIIVRLIGAELSRLVCASSAVISSLRLDRAALGLEDQAHRRLLARLVAHAVEHAPAPAP